jgi:hypothetical protein
MLKDGMHSATNTRESERQLARGVLVGSIGVFVLTSIHHGYGAYIYKTPWRLHAVIVSGAVTLLMSGLLMLFRSPHVRVGKLARFCFVILGLFVPFLGFGIFEGGYNHVVKDILYFSNTSPELMRLLFPPDRYELPNNVLFEVTGVLQFVPGVVTGYYLVQLAQNFGRGHSAPTEDHHPVFSSLC